MNIIFIGMAGSGKSTIGKRLAKKLDKKLLETDDSVEEKVKMSISAFVEKSGWKKFRNLESEVINQTSETDNTVISTGGGAVIRDKNIACLKKNGVLFWLKANVDTLTERLKNGKKRPLFGHCRILKKEIAQMYGERKKLYEKAADFVIETDGKTADGVMSEIIFVLKERDFL